MFIYADKDITNKMKTLHGYHAETSNPDSSKYRDTINHKGRVYNKTAIFVTHRLSMTKFVDKIAVIEEGKIIEFGTHQELLRKNHQYTQMYKAQSSMYINYR